MSSVKLNQVWERRLCLSSLLSNNWSQWMVKFLSLLCAMPGIMIGLPLMIMFDCYTSAFRELAYQIYKEYERFSKYFDGIKISVFFGGISIKTDEETLRTNCPHIVVGTPGRILALVRQKSLNLRNVKHFILDECDKMLEQLGKRSTRLLQYLLSFLKTCVEMFKKFTK